MPDSKNPASDPDEAVPVNAVHDETNLLRPQMIARAPYYALRILNGAKLTRDVDDQYVSIRICGNEYRVSVEMFGILDRIVDRMQREVISQRGMWKPYNVEDQIRLHVESQRIATQEFDIDPKLLRVFFMRQDMGGCGFYRVIQPVRHLNDACKDTISAAQTDFLRYSMCAYFDVIVAPRVVDPHSIAVLRELKAAGKIIVYESDDLLRDSPKWNPVHDELNRGAALRDFIIEESDAMIVATEELEQYMGKPGVTHVCHNGITPALWPMEVKELKQAMPVKILWGGSATHEQDLEVIVPAMTRLIKRFGNRVQFHFVHYMPKAISMAELVDGRAQLAVKREWREHVTLHSGCGVLKWPEHLAKLRCDIALAPLIDHPFNRCKSELKVLEAWALGIPIVASDIEPYRRAIKSGVNGMLCNKDPNSWFEAIAKLIDNPDQRKTLATNGLEDLKERYVMSKVVHQYERALLKIASGRIDRPACASMIEGRLAQLQ